MRTCEVVENDKPCERVHKARGMCAKHYARWQTHGDPLIALLVHEQRENEKWCADCEQWLPKSEFNKNSQRRDGLQQFCCTCHADRHLQRKYGISRAGREQMLADQGGCCLICGTDNHGGSRFWHIDHDHSCCPGNKSCGNCIRGLLCSNCNTGLGMFGDDPDRLESAIAYLRGAALADLQEPAN